MPRRPPAIDRGASLVEYAAVIALVGAIAVAVTSLLIPARITEQVTQAVGCLFSAEDCDASESSGGGPAPDAGGDPEPDPGGDPPERSESRRTVPDPESSQPQNAGAPEEQSAPQPENADLPDDIRPGDEPVDARPVSLPLSDDSQAPSPEAKPDEVNDWWEGLSQSERDAVMREDPDSIRNLDGIPAEVRNELNREFLDEEVERMLEDEGFTFEEVREYSLEDVRDRWNFDAPSLELWELAKLEATLNGDLDDPESDRSGEDAFLLGLDPEEETAIVSTTNPDTADNVSTLVPGTGIAWTAVNGQFGRAGAVHDSAAASDEDADVASIAWLGYGEPNWGQAPFGRNADKGKDDLQDFQYGLRVTHEGEPSNNTLIGHSYGSVVAGAAAANESGAYVDNLVFVGSPGVGHDLEDLNFNGDMEDIHVISSEEDWVSDGFFGGFTSHDRDKLDNPDVTHVTADTDEHDEYFNDTESTEMMHLGDVVSGATR